jgi:hypothetical protein
MVLIAKGLKWPPCLMICGSTVCYRLFNAGDKQSQGGETVVIVAVMEGPDRCQRLREAFIYVTISSFLQA